MSSIAVGTLIDLDAAVQADGSLLATRIEVDDPSAIAEFVGRWTFTNGQPGPSLYCAVIVKRVDAQTRAKTAINELLRT